MKVKIEEGCITCGACESICEAVFTVEDTVIVNEAAIAGNEEAVKEAADACPVSVIIIEE
jgi:ferredoxin